MNVEQVRAKQFDAVTAAYTRKDVMLYGLGVNACQDRLDDGDLRFVYEKDLQTLPSYCCVLAHPGMWVKEPSLELDVTRLVHAEQSFELLRPLPTEGEVVADYAIRGVTDKGAEKGALMFFRKTLRTADGQALGQVDSTYFLRGDGGCGDWGETGSPPAPMPDTPPDGHIDTVSSPVSALIYRLCGDSNPLHVDPQLAGKAGFDSPILHGLCTYGMACQALVKALCDNRADRLRGMTARFTRPFYPGDTLRTEYWRQPGGTLRFRCRSMANDAVVLDSGSLRLFD